MRPDWVLPRVQAWRRASVVAGGGKIALFASWPLQSTLLLVRQRARPSFCNAMPLHAPQALTMCRWASSLRRREPGAAATLRS